MSALSPETLEQALLRASRGDVAGRATLLDLLLAPGPAASALDQIDENGATLRQRVRAALLPGDEAAPSPVAGAESSRDDRARTATPKKKKVDKSDASSRKEEGQKSKDEKEEKERLPKKEKEEEKKRPPTFDKDFKKLHFGELPSKTLKLLRAAPVQPKPAAKKKNQKDFDRYEKHLKRAILDRKLIDQGHYSGDSMDPMTKVVAKRLIWTSFAVNVILVVVKLVAFILSGSLAVFASFLHSILDVLTTSIIFGAERIIAKEDPYNYPTGRKRMEALAVIGFSCGMFAATSQVIVAAIEALIDIKNIVVNPDIPTYAIVAFTILVKFILWLLCRRIRTPALQALATDHRNDTLSNVVSLLTILGSFYWNKMCDPVGAMLIAVFIMATWAYQGIKLLLLASGRTAKPALLSRIAYIAYKHDKRIIGVDTVRAYGVSERYNVECDIQLPRSMPLKETHDIGETLQLKLEQLPEVERAFVHVDYDTGHKAIDEHPAPLKKKPLDASSDSSEERLRHLPKERHLLLSEATGSEVVINMGVELVPAPKLSEEAEDAKEEEEEDGEVEEVASDDSNQLILKD